MATLRKDICRERLPKDKRGKGSFYGIHCHTGIIIGMQNFTFSAPINDLYGPHVTFGSADQLK